MRQKCEYYQNKSSALIARMLGEFTPSYILHTRAFGTYLLGGGYLPCKKNQGDGILHVNMFHYIRISYFTCTVFTKYTYNEYIGPYFFIARCSMIFANELPELV
jgi:hypothetical protein